MSDNHPSDENLTGLGRKLLFLDDMRNVDRICYALYGLCALLFVADFFYHKHTYVWVEDFPGFYAIYGFVMCALLVICAKGMRVVLKRPENYYGKRGVEAEEHAESDLDRREFDA